MAPKQFKVKGVLFDLDNTLIDFMAMKKKCTEAAVDAMISAGLGMSHKRAYGLLMKLYKEYGIEDQTIYQKFLRKHAKMDFKILSAGIVAYRKMRATRLVPYSGVRKTLSLLKRRGLKLGVVSDAPRLQVWLRLTEMKLVPYFEVVLGFEDTGRLKPSPAPFRKALKKMKLPASQVMFVGDNPKRDIVGAKKVGMVTVLAKYGRSGRSGGDYVLSDISDLVRIVNLV